MELFSFSVPRKRFTKTVSLFSPILFPVRGLNLYFNSVFLSCFITNTRRMKAVLGEYRTLSLGLFLLPPPSNKYYVKCTLYTKTSNNDTWLN